MVRKEDNSISERRLEGNGKGERLLIAADREWIVWEGGPSVQGAGCMCL